MDKEERRRLTKEIGLEASYRFFKFAAGSEYLHYGLFEPDIPTDFQHLKQAQDRYLDRLIELIPSNVKTILDVGAGSGKTAEVLTERGFKVDCVSPGKMLGDLVEARLKTGSTLYRGRFEEVAIPNSYDLVLFSESFQYIPIDIAITKAMSLLNPGGHILICDFFKKTEAGPSPVGGGHAFGTWQKYLGTAPFETVVERNITKETAPVLDILNQFNQEVFKPLAESGSIAASARWPLVTRLVRFVFRRDIDKLWRKRFSGRATGAEFERAKVYMIYLLKRRQS
jgi:2-polyprenyl-3-methyl-5-hydroxy-6-metoxy-1,4-benzoquinol methylase